MIDADLAAVESSPWSSRLRTLVRDYKAAGLPAMNGGFTYSNLREGADQILTCNPYRLWEYGSLFLRYDPARPWRTFLDVGGAASPLPFLLAELGIGGRAVDLQPLLVAVCNHVASVRALPLAAAVIDITAESEAPESFDLITCISVLEHIAPANRARVLQSIFRALRPGGLFYMTFDYGDYVETDQYRGAESHTTSSVPDLGELCASIEACGFIFEGNDPRDLPGDMLGLRSAPAAKRVTQRYTVNTDVFDAATPWTTLAKYAIKRVLPGVSRVESRFERHNFFRMFLRRPA